MFALARRLHLCRTVLIGYRARIFAARCNINVKKCRSPSIFLPKDLQISKNCCTFASAFDQSEKESCLSGRKSHTRNVVYALRRTGGSNPSLSARKFGNVREMKKKRRTFLLFCLLAFTKRHCKDAPCKVLGLRRNPSLSFPQNPSLSFPKQSLPLTFSPIIRKTSRIICIIRKNFVPL